MKSTITAGIAAAALVLAACGGGGGSDTDSAADNLISFADDQDLELDESCVKDLAKGFSDDDAKALADAGSDPENAEISEAGDEIAEQMFNDCVDAASYVNTVVNGLTESDASIDADCLRGELDGLTVEEIDEKLFDAAFACSEG